MKTENTYNVEVTEQSIVNAMKIERAKNNYASFLRDYCLQWDASPLVTDSESLTALLTAPAKRQLIAQGELSRFVKRVGNNHRFVNLIIETITDGCDKENEFLAENVIGALQLGFPLQQITDSVIGTKKPKTKRLAGFVEWMVFAPEWEIVKNVEDDTEETEETEETDVSDHKVIKDNSEANPPKKRESKPAETASDRIESDPTPFTTLPSMQQIGEAQLAINALITKGHEFLAESEIAVLTAASRILEKSKDFTE